MDVKGFGPQKCERYGKMMPPRVGGGVMSLNDIKNIQFRTHDSSAYLGQPTIRAENNGVHA